jgi:class 3 adenylate cyclase/tetratricopeptide (TPR) repeat protein
MTQPSDAGFSEPRDTSSPDAPTRDAHATAVLRRVLRYLPDITVRLEDLLYAVAAHLPRVIAGPMLTAPSTEPIALPLEGTAMFADINGFTQLSERFSQVASQQGAEELTELVNRFLDILITTTANYGGDLQKFGGDAGMLLFTGEHHALGAVAAALEVQREMHAQMGQVETSLGQFPLRISIGLGSGQMVGLGLGDLQGREWLVSGPPLRAMGRAQSAAPQGSVVMDHSTHQCCSDAVAGEALDERHMLVHDVTAPPKAPELTHLPRPPQVEEEERLSWLLSRMDALTPYLAPSLLERLTTATHPEQVYRWSEHRQVTVLMLSFAGFPDLSVFWQSPEALQRAVGEPNAAFVRVRDIIHRFDGIVNKIGIGPQGPYLMALFGAPKAHEDDPLRATLAALELQEQAELPLRLGINTGFVFAGNVGTAERREYTVMGDEVNLAYRLMSGCPPGQIWLGPNTAAHTTIARRVDGERGAPQAFKGKRDPIAPFIVAGLRRRIPVAEMAEDTALVDREEALQHIKDALQRSQTGEVQIGIVHGPAGVGKSRLAHEVAAHARALGFQACVGTAPSYGTHLPYAAWSRPLRTLLKLEDVPPAAQPEALQATLDRHGLGPWAALVAPLIGLDVAPSPEVAALTPELRDNQRQVVLATLLEQATRDPCLLILENAQWMPPTSLSLLNYLLDHPPQSALMLLVTHRDEGDFGQPWQGREDLLDFALPPFTRRHSLQLARRAAANAELPREVERWVAKRGSGLPLFTIEAIRTLITSGILERHNGGWRLSQPLEEAPLPETAYGVLQSRIDQLEPPSRHLLRAATVVGEQMTVPMLIAGYGDETRTAVERRLAHLVPLGLVPGDAQGETLIFRQPLIREVAYRGLPYRIRAVIHQRLAEYLNTRREQATSNWLTLLAHHAFEGQNWQLAVQANLELGRRALNTYLIDQAVQALERTLKAADAGQLPVPEARFEAHHLLGDTLTILGEYDAALEHLDHARRQLPEVPSDMKDIERLADLDYHVASVYENQGRYQEAFAAIEHGLSLPNIPETVAGAQLQMKKAGLYHRQGNYDEEAQWARKSAALAERLPGTEALKVRARAIYLLAYLASLRGEPERALQLGQESLDIYQRLQDLLGEINARTNLLLINLALSRWDKAVEHGEQALTMARRIRNVEGEARLSANLGEVYRYQGRLQEAREAYTTTLHLARDLGITYGEALMENNLAAVALREGQWDEAEELLEDAEARFKTIGSEEMLAELYRHRAELNLHRRDLDAAQTWAERALDLAEAQKARTEAGRTWKLLADIRLAQGAPPSAAAALAEAVTRLQEAKDRYGEAQAWLTEARIHHAQGEDERAHRTLQRAIDEFEALGARWDLAQARESRALENAVPREA